jgi:hypothetical protein
MGDGEAAGFVHGQAEALQRGRSKFMRLATRKTASLISCLEKGSAGRRSLTRSPLSLNGQTSFPGLPWAVRSLTLMACGRARP